MAIPAANVQPAVQAAQQQIQKPDTVKNGPSRFDQTLAQKAESSANTAGAHQVQASEKALAMQKVGQTEQMQRASALEMVRKSRSLKHNDPTQALSSTDKMGKSIERALTNLESRNASMDKFINKAIGGNLNLNHQQLLGLQAKVSQYSLELDLTSKVVEKATTGLKDTLRTQV